jgi:16S rRNA (adenine1518-N6/adenine1519-N6)-dimethyltransferase
LQTKRQIQALLAQIRARPRRRLGQNFMIDGNLIRLLAEAGDLSGDDWIVEVGPGTGSLTEHLLAAAGQVTAVEIDRDLAGLLRGRFAAQSGFTLIEADALASKHALNAELLQGIQSALQKGRTVKLVANLPYQIASPLVIEMLLAGAGLLAFTVQKEVAQRLGAAAGTKPYGPLSVMAQLLARVQLLRTLPPQAFWPMPKVESALVRMIRQDQLGAQAPAFGRFVHAAFAHRRKTLRNSLAAAGVTPAAAETALRRLELSPSARPQELSPPRWQKLFDALNSA